MQAGFSGTRREWLESLKGKDGRDGRDGFGGVVVQQVGGSAGTGNSYWPTGW